MNQQFFELIRVALHRQNCMSHTPSAKEWVGLYHIAEKQALLGVCFYAIRRLDVQEQSVNLPEAIRMQWLGVTAQIQRRNEVLNGRCVELQKMLKDAGFRSCILKGQAIAHYYKLKDENLELRANSLGMLRQSGDIDVWVDGVRKQIMEYVNSIAPTEDVRWLHTQLNVFDDAAVEVHFMPSYLECPWQNRALQRFFDSEKEACFASGKCTDRFNQVFILAHAFRHVFGEGVGLRQLMDFYYVLKNSKERLSRDEFCKVMKETGMLRLAKAVMWIMKEVFGLEDRYLLCTTLENDGRFLLEEVMQSGNFGHQDNRVKHKADENAFHRFWRIALYNCRVIRFSPWIVVCSPFWRLWHWIWRKSKGYK